MMRSLMNGEIEAFEICANIMLNNLILSGICTFPDGQSIMGLTVLNQGRPYPTLVLLA